MQKCGSSFQYQLMYTSIQKQIHVKIFSHPKQKDFLPFHLAFYKNVRSALKYLLLDGGIAGPLNVGSFILIFSVFEVMSLYYFQNQIKIFCFCKRENIKFSQFR